MVQWHYEKFEHRGQKWERKCAAPEEAWYLGVDPAQAIDYTAISVLHSTVTPLDDWDVNEDACKTMQKVDQRFDIVGLHRLPQGMLYPDQVTCIQEALAAVRHPCDVVIDDTSNFAVGDLLVERGIRPVRIRFTSGAEATLLGHRKYGVPKSILVGHVDAKLNVNELHFAKDLTESEALKDEFVNFRRHLSAAGNALFEARSGRHDDIIFSIACALWWAIERPKREFLHVGTHICG